MMAGADSAGRIAVLDMGKTNVKLSAVTAEGHVVETLAVPNGVLAGPPWRHNDLAGLGEWALSGLAALCRRYPIGRVIAAAYGSGGVLVGDDPDAGGSGAALPMIDYEQPLPDGLAESYAPLSGSFLDRGSAIMQASTHQARQMFWMQRAAPEAFAAARWYLGLPQYWAWRLCGVAASEHSFLGAQTHLWNVVEQRFAPIVASRGWERLMPPFAPAWKALGRIREELAHRHGLPPDIEVHTGAHDSSVNYYRYQAAGESDFAVVSTGTWIVALADNVPVASLDEHRNMTCNSDVFGKPLGGALTMGGREFGHVAGEQPQGAMADPGAVSRLVARGTMALPAFGADGGQFPGSAGAGRITGPPPETAAERLALAVLYMALLTVTCADLLGHRRRVILDGSYLRDPLYAALVAALRPDAATLFSLESSGIASGAALLCGHDRRTAPAHAALERPGIPRGLEALPAYAARWQDEARRNSHSNRPTEGKEA